MAHPFLPIHSQIFRKLGRPAFRLLFRLLTRVKISGQERIPTSGSYIVASNHISIFEPPLLASFWPHPLEIAAAVEVLDKPFQSQIMRLYGTIHVNRGRLDRTLVRTILNRLAAGFPVLIFPEGRRSQKPGLVSGMSGAAYLAGKAGVGIVPVGITGTESLSEGIKRFNRPQISLTVGPMLHLPSEDLRGARRKSVLSESTVTIMKAIASLLPLEYRGEYA